MLFNISLRLQPSRGLVNFISAFYGQFYPVVNTENATGQSRQSHPGQIPHAAAPSVLLLRAGGSYGSGDNQAGYTAGSPGSISTSLRGWPPCDGRDWPPTAAGRIAH